MLLGTGWRGNMPIFGVPFLRNILPFCLLLILGQITGCGSDPELLKRIQKGFDFYLVKDTALSEQQLQPVDPQTEMILTEPVMGSAPRFYKVVIPPAMSGKSVAEAYKALDDMGSPIIKISLDEPGARQFEEITAKHIGEPLALVYKGRVMTAPTIQSKISGGKAQITGRNINLIFEDRPEPSSGAGPTGQGAENSEKK